MKGKGAGWFFKVTLGMTLMILLAVLATACSRGPEKQAGSPKESEQQKKVIRLAYPTGVGSAQHQGSLLFKQKLESRSQGKFEVQLYPDGQLGKDVAVMDSLKLGTIEMTNVSTPLDTKVKEVGIFDLPYLFKDRTAVAKIAKGPIWKEIAAKLPAQGMVGLAMLENGYRHITNNKRPIVKPEDLKGLKIRIPEGRMRMETFKAYGANPTPLNFNEVFSALQQGVVDGQENPLATIYSSKFYEVQKYLSLSKHIYTPSYLVVSKIWWEKLTPEEQKLIMEIAQEVGDEVRAWGEEQDKQMVQKLKDAGMQINEVDFEAFKKASEPVYKLAQEMYGEDLVNRVLEAVK